MLEECLMFRWLYDTYYALRYILFSKELALLIVKSADADKFSSIFIP